MSFMKKTQQVGNVFVESYGSTENLGGGFIQTEKVDDLTNAYSGPVGPTEQADGAFVDFNRDSIDPISKTQGAYEIKVDNQGTVAPVVGWLVCIGGPNLGKEFRIHSDYNYMGSLEGDIIVPHDPKISRKHHMVITFDPTDRRFFVSPDAGANIIRLNNRALIGGQEIKNYDVIKTGDSTFMFIGFCGESFGWENVLNG